MKDWFEDAGIRLKNIINAVFTIEIVLHCIAAFVLLIMSIDSEEFGMFLLGLIGLALSLGLSWLGLLAIAAFADLVIDTNEIKTQLQESSRPTTAYPRDYPRTTARPQSAPAAAPTAAPVKESAAPTGQQSTAATAKVVYCPRCGKSQHATKYCFNCGAPLE